MSIEGEILIKLKTNPEGIDQVGVQSTRPLSITQGFIGLQPTQVKHMIGLMFGLCGVAQQIAAKRAIDQAEGIRIGSQRVNENSIKHSYAKTVMYLQNGLLQCETAREHLMRMMLEQRFSQRDTISGNQVSHSEKVLSDQNLIQQINLLFSRLKVQVFAEGLVAQPELIKTVESQFKNLVDALQTVVEEQVLSHPLHLWGELQTLDDLAVLTGEQSSRVHSESFNHTVYSQLAQLNDVAELGRNSVGFLPSLSPVLLDTQLCKPSSTSFIAQPQWQGHCFETSSLSRQQDKPLIQQGLQRWGNGLLTRCIARIQELVDIVRGLHRWHGEQSDTVVIDEAQLCDGVGLSQVEAARGKLIHRVAVKDNTITQYQIVAPTEWNFHPNGVLAAALGGLTEKNHVRLREQAERIIRAIDPCVGFRLSMQ